MVTVASHRTNSAEFTARTWTEAVRAAGDLLVQSGAADECYVEAMLRAAHELGPYYVIAPGIAVPHARPEEGARLSGVSVLRLDPPVRFGSPEHDPVRLVVAFCSPDPVGHVLLFAQIARKTSEAGFFEQVKTAKSASDLAALFSSGDS